MPDEPGNDNVLLSAILNAQRSGVRKFEVLKPHLEWAIMGLTGKDKGFAYLIPDHVYGPQYFWWLVTFVQIEFYDNQKDGNKYDGKPFQYMKGLSIHYTELGTGVSIAEKSLAEFEQFERGVQAMNDRGYLSLFDTDEYDGPLAVKGCKLVANPDFFTNVVRAIQ